MTCCLACASERKETILDLGAQPISSHFMASADAAVIKHELALALCRTCGLVQLAQPFPAQDLSPPYAWITYREPENHLDAVVERLLGFLSADRGVTAAGLSFKDATTLKRLAARGFSSNWTVDTREDLGAGTDSAGVESVQGLLTAEAAGTLAARRGPAHVLIARHILEHAEAPRRFLAALSEMLAPDGLLVLEVPDCAGNLARQDYTMIWEEHALYFTRETLPPTVAAAGFDVVALEVHPYSFEDVLVLYARKRAPGNASHIARNPDATRRSIQVAEGYGAGFQPWTRQYRRVLEGLTGGKMAAAAYGAGHLTAAFINFHGLADYFAFVVDDTPHKQGLYLPGCGLPIVANSHLTPDAVSTCLFGLSPDIEDKVIAKNAPYAKGGGRFFSMFADSPRSIRALVAEPGDASAAEARR